MFLINRRLLFCIKQLSFASTSTVPANFKVLIIKYKIKIIQVFDRQSKLLQRNRAAKAENFKEFLYIRNEIGERIADKIFDIVGRHEVCLDLGCAAGHIAPHLIRENVGVLIQCDMSLEMVKQSSGVPVKEKVFNLF